MMMMSDGDEMWSRERGRRRSRGIETKTRLISRFRWHKGRRREFSRFRKNKKFVWINRKNIYNFVTMTNFSVYLSLKFMFHWFIVQQPRKKMKKYLIVLQLCRLSLSNDDSEFDVNVIDINNSICQPFSVWNYICGWLDDNPISVIVYAAERMLQDNHISILNHNLFVFFTCLSLCLLLLSLPPGYGVLSRVRWSERKQFPDNFVVEERECVHSWILAPQRLFCLFIVVVVIGSSKPNEEID